MIQQTLVLKKPVITEKSINDAARGVYTFEVDVKADKNIIRKTIEEMFNVHVTKITTVKTKGKKRSAGKKRIAVLQPDRKKARVRLKSGEKISIFEVGQTK